MSSHWYCTGGNVYLNLSFFWIKSKAERRAVSLLSGEMEYVSLTGEEHFERSYLQINHEFSRVFLTVVYCWSTCHPEISSYVIVVGQHFWGTRLPVRRQNEQKDFCRGLLLCSSHWKSRKLLGASSFDKSVFFVIPFKRNCSWGFQRNLKDLGVQFPGRGYTRGRLTPVP